MRKLRLVKRDDRPRRERETAASSEVRFRYPAEEIWEVSEDHWHIADDERQPAAERSTN